MWRWGSTARYSDPEQGRDDPRGHPELWICSAPDTLCDLDGLLHSLGLNFPSSTLKG